MHVIQPNPNDMSYPNFIPWMMKNLSWDVGIAPLEDTIFNRCKSDIKFLDYSALGVPGIYSRVPSYKETIHHLETGYLVENTPSAWTEALAELLTNNELRTQLAFNQERHDLLQRGQELFAGKRLLFVLPIAATGGDPDLILLAAEPCARCM